jgi:2-polyprenyl-6-methoxyphenol hydroxylase-like FAD-dependent oxidoreductase
MRAIIAGGGIGGLAAALALVRRGWDVEVLERAPAFAEVGAGLSLWPNGLRAVDALGVGAQVRGRALLEGQAGIQDSAGRWITRTDTAALERRFGSVAMIHRADLLEVLRGAVPADSLRHGVTVRRVSPGGTVAHSGGESRADLVVGADGVRSVVRASIWPDAPAPRYAGYTAWRMVTPPVQVDGTVPDDTVESWGAGERFGYVPLPDGRVYCAPQAHADDHAPVAPHRRGRAVGVPASRAPA